MIVGVSSLQRLSGAVCVAGAVLMTTAFAAQSQSADAWRGQITLYGWGAGIGGDIRPRAGAPEISLDKSLSEVLEDLDSALFVTGFARKGNLVLLGDLSYSSSSRKGVVPPGAPARGELEQRSITLAAGQRVTDNADASVDILGGIRAWDVEGSVAVPLAGVNLSFDKTFVDPILAVRGNLRIAPQWSVIGYFDAGGLGVGSDVTYQIAVTANYQATDSLYLSFGYRHLYVDYDSGGASIKTNISGPLLGATLRF